MDKYEIRGKTPAIVRKNLAVYPELLQDLLYSRDIKTEKEAEEFLNPDYAKLHDPFLMRGMDVAVERILKAIKEGEKTVIYSDYDADGIPGAVILHDFFKKIGYTNFTNYIPHRHHEGFGLHLEAIDTFVADSAHLLITIDCGIADASEIAHAKAKGIDVIITDHHLCGPETLEAHAVLNSKQDNCEYPYKMLCGSGVVFKLIQALIARGKERGLFEMKSGQEKWFLDMVGIATLSDMVPLKGENRILAHFAANLLVLDWCDF
jgi:single-stranded-DNA-specific exonuclease